jgi:hypothetical protein
MRDVSVAAAANPAQGVRIEGFQVMNAGTPVLGDTVTPGHSSITPSPSRALKTDWTRMDTQIGMQDPILSDVISRWACDQGRLAATTAAGITLPGTVTPIGQNVRLEATGSSWRGRPSR